MVPFRVDGHIYIYINVAFERYGVIYSPRVYSLGVVLGILSVVVFMKLVFMLFRKFIVMFLLCR